MTKKTKIILTIVAIVVAASVMFIFGFLSARKLYKVSSVDSQVAKLTSQLNEATIKLSSMQTKYDEMLTLNEEMSRQAENVQLNLSQALQLCEKSKSTVNELKNLSNAGNTEATDIRSALQQLIRSNAVIKDKVLILEQDLSELQRKIVFIPE